MGVAVKHIGQRMKFDGPGLLNRGSLDGARRSTAFYYVDASSADLPSTFEIGLGYRYPMAELGQLNLGTMFQHNNYTYDEYRTGAEYIYRDFLALRGGFSYAADADAGTYPFGSSLGIGLNLNMGGKLQEAHVDYAYTATDYFDAINTLTFQVGF